MKFGDNLQSIRKYKKISQEMLAEKVGVSRQSVSKWERGESYPEMANILILCDIFGCKINDLVHESMADIDSLGEEVKSCVVKFKKEKQEKVKALSKIIYIIARIFKILCSLAISVVILFMILSPIIVNSVKIVDDKTIELWGKSYYSENNDLVWQNADKEFRIADIEMDTVIKVIKNYSTITLIGFVEIVAVSIICTFILIYLILKHLEKLFMNIYNGETPFTLENVNHIKKVAIYMIASIVFPYICGKIVELILGEDMQVDFEFINCIQILFLFSMAYMFEYGYEIQQDSNGRIYGEE